MEPWQLQARKGQDILANSIPRQYLVPSHKLPPQSQKNVVDFPRQSGLFTSKELTITEMSASDLVREMNAGRLWAEEVVKAFLKRAVVGHQLLNFATEFMAEEAIARARGLDDHVRKTGKLVGPLHGIPISVKEHIGMKDRTCNAGFVAWVEKTVDEDALLLQCLRNAGAIFHVRTNQPQSLMHLCCSNNITGTTLNPYNRTLTPGGSSGGEGASMGFKCAPLGVGSDIGGSIRVPAAFCGAYGLRPTAMRNPVTGIKVPCPGQESIHGVVGPMASSSIEDLELFQRAIIDQEPWDTETSLAPVPWKRAKPDRNMTVGIIWDDGHVRPHPPVTRALHHAQAKLQAAGINVVAWEPYKHDHGWKIISTLYFPDGALSTLTQLHRSNEPIHPLTAHAVSNSASGALRIDENWALNDARDVYRDEHHALMKARGVDFLLGPVYPGAAAVLGESEYWNYSAIWNLLDLPAVAFPAAVVVDEAVDLVESGYVARSEVDGREWRKYAPGRYEGAPVGLQLAGRRFRDEETVAAACLVSGVIGAKTERARV